jgi:hypothetical protein
MPQKTLTIIRISGLAVENDACLCYVASARQVRIQTNSDTPAAFVLDMFSGLVNIALGTETLC